MDDKQFQRLLKKAQSDESLFHKMVFTPADAVDELGFLDQADRDRILKVSPEGVLRDIISGKRLAADCEVTVQCGFTCTHTSSLQDALVKDFGQAADCGVTVQCTHTCGHTSSIDDKFQGLAENIKTSIEKRRGG